MMNKKYPLTLSKLRFSTYNDKDEIANEYPGTDLFDDRHDFAYGLYQKGLAVLMVFTNERALSNEDTRGIRRQITVSLIDATDKCVLHTHTLRVNIYSNDIIGIYRVDFPLTYSDINTNHTYKIIVHDDNSHNILGEEFVHMFDEYKYGKHISNCFNILSGGVCEIYNTDLYKSLNPDFLTYYRVLFNIAPMFEETPFIYPEFEIRIFYPNGIMETQFCQLECDDYDLNEYHVDMHFLMDIQKKGICYAELLCMDYPLAGFAFDTNGEWISGAWTGRNLDCLDEYSHLEACRRFRKAIDIDFDKETDNDNDEFEKALKTFISSSVDTKDSQEESNDISVSDINVNDYNDNNTDDNSNTPDNNTDKSPLAKLKSLTGLKSVKDKLTTYERIVRFNKLRRDNNLPVSKMPLHAMFLGSPGTGKTTVAKMMGQMLAMAGVLSKGHVIVKERSTLLGPNYSMEETNTLDAIEEAQGGILLIDEAYQLFQPNDPRDPGKFVIEALMSALADESRRDWMLILAGYPDEMRRMFDINPGLRSRIPESNIYVFDDFSESELMEIAEHYLAANCYRLSDEARQILSYRLRYDYLRRDKSFGNARHVINMIETEILPAMAIRVVQSEQSDPESLSEILACDIPRQSIIATDNRRRIGYRA